MKRKYQRLYIQDKICFHPEHLLYSGRIYPHSGGDCINYAIERFKEYVRYYYNTYADPELVKQYHEEKKKSVAYATEYKK